MSNDFRLNRYLARIGFGGTVGPDFATLAAIHAAHIHAIPFENFDPLLRRPVKARSCLGAGKARRRSTRRLLF